MTTSNQIKKVIGTVVFVVTLIPFWGSAYASTESQNQTIAIVNGMLITGYEADPVHNSVVIIKGNKIVKAGYKNEIEVPKGAHVIDASGKTVMPGLIDLHGHLELLGHGDYKEYYKYIKGTDRLDEMREIASRQLLRAGVTSFVDLGSTPGILKTKQKINQGKIPGPRLIVSGPWISRVAVGIVPAEMAHVIKSTKEAKAKTIANIKAGYDIIKVWEGLTQEDYNVVVEEAHKRGVKVHAHLYHPEKINLALNAGVDVLQHMGSAKNPPYSQALLSRVAHSNKPVIQTIAHRVWIYPETVDFPARLQDSRLKETLPAELYEEFQRSFVYFQKNSYFSHVEREIRNSKIAARQFIESGAVIGVGTDGGSPMNFHTEAMWREMNALVDSGMSPIAVLSAATKTNGTILGTLSHFGFNEARSLGTIEKGKLADIILVDGNPLYHMSALNKPSLVIKDGIVWYTEKNSTPLLKKIGRKF